MEVSPKVAEGAARVIYEFIPVIDPETGTAIRMYDAEPEVQAQYYEAAVKTIERVILPEMMQDTKSVVESFVNNINKQNQALYAIVDCCQVRHGLSYEHLLQEILRIAQLGMVK